MTKSEYQELVEFLSGKFAQIDTRFEQIDTRFAQIDARFEQVDARFDRVDQRFDQIDVRLTATEEAIRHNGILIERNHGLIRQVAEGVLMVDERVSRLEHTVIALDGKFERFRTKIEAGSN